MCEGLFVECCVDCAVDTWCFWWKIRAWEQKVKHIITLCGSQSQTQSRQISRCQRRPTSWWIARCRAGHIQHAHEGWAIYAKYAVTISVKTEKASVCLQLVAAALSKCRNQISQLAAVTGHTLPACVQQQYSLTVVPQLWHKYKVTAEHFSLTITEVTQPWSLCHIVKLMWEVVSLLNLGSNFWSSCLKNCFSITCNCTINFHPSFHFLSHGVQLASAASWRSSDTLRSHLFVRHISSCWDLLPVSLLLLSFFPPSVRTIFCKWGCWNDYRRLRAALSCIGECKHM